MIRGIGDLGLRALPGLRQTCARVFAEERFDALWPLTDGRRPTIGGYRTGVRYRAEELDFRALAKLARRGRVGELSRGLLPRPRTVHAVFARDDPLPLLTSVGLVLTALRT